jgi:hypothetical protein
VGITVDVARFMLESPRPEGFRSTLTLGRLRLFVSRRQLRALGRDFGFDASVLELSRFSEPFLTHCLGATSVSAMDASPYEGAALVHDLNRPVAAELEQTFETVIDGGTLEHVFNFPVALASSMRMLRVGGRLFLCCPANNLMGHGFYQLSPELLYRSLSAPHGFEVERMHLVRSKYVSTELDAVGGRLDVADPADLGTRTVVTSRHPLSLLVCARKVKHLGDPFASPPLQSDYVRAWASGNGAGTGGIQPAVQRLVTQVWSRLPATLKWKAWNEYGRWYRHTVHNRAWFKRAARRDARSEDVRRDVTRPRA